MGLAKKVNLAEAIVSDRGKELSTALFNQFNTFHSKGQRPIKEIEEILVKQRLLEFEAVGVKSPRPSTYIFSPSGASKCCRELYYRANSVRVIEDMYPYHRRWTRNSTAVHEAIQRDLLYMGITMNNPAFTVKLKENGLPAWEQNLKDFKEFNVDGQEFAVLGMMDGILAYKDGSEVGFEFKTKSNSIGQVGNYKMKAPAPYHEEQCVAYSLLFGMDEFILMYESVAKDQWNKKAEAKSDIRTFYFKATDEDRQKLLDKFAYVVKCVEEKELPPMDTDKCMMCGYKHICMKEGC